MPYEFTEWEQEPEPKESSGRSDIPPRTIIGVGVLDAPVPSKKPPSVLLRILAALMLLGVVVLIVTISLLRHQPRSQHSFVLRACPATNLLG